MTNVTNVDTIPYRGGVPRVTLNLGHIGINSVRVYHIEIKHHVGYIITLPNPTIPSIQIQPDPSESFESILGLELYYLEPNNPYNLEKWVEWVE